MWLLLQLYLGCIIGYCKNVVANFAVGDTIISDPIYVPDNQEELAANEAEVKEILLDACARLTVERVNAFRMASNREQLLALLPPDLADSFNSLFTRLEMFQSKGWPMDLLEPQIRFFFFAKGSFQRRFTETFISAIMPTNEDYVDEKEFIMYLQDMEANLDHIRPEYAPYFREAIALDKAQIKDFVWGELYEEVTE